MTTNIFRKVAAALILGGSMTSAHALSVGLNPSDLIGGIGSSFSMHVVVDFTDDPTLGGGFDIAFDGTTLAFVDYDASICDVGCDPSFGRAPDVSDGLLSGIAFGNFNGISGPGVVGTVTFVLTRVRSNEIILSDTANAIVGPFVSAVTFLPQDVEYSGARYALIPLPTAAWLLLGGLGTLLGFRRMLSEESLSPRWRS